MHTLQSFCRRVIDLLFPRVCDGCGAYGTFLCEPCLLRIPSATPPKDSFINATFDYHDNVLRRVIWRFKYKNAREVARYFGKILYEEIISGLNDDLHTSKNETFLLVPIPLHKHRLRERGYNQSELLAQEITKCDTHTLFFLAPRALVRTKNTHTQTKKQKRTARFENLRGAFVATPAMVHGKHIILIDDVTTTGATFSEARKALLKAGAKTVRAYAVAH